ncbi:hypothetical protein T01_7491 [Trichinella spiralis]|uniref:Uncharacterized protein n=1 Tax=Trichinella spiralis TaxID=6334 RepID=A0A0V1AH86_TRISP|nr:hypothetical protein T01_7491 [Trichinella spiralis]
MDFFFIFIRYCPSCPCSEALTSNSRSFCENSLLISIDVRK